MRLNVAYERANRISDLNHDARWRSIGPWVKPLIESHVAGRPKSKSDGLAEVSSNHRARNFAHKLRACMTQLGRLSVLLGATSGGSKKIVLACTGGGGATHSLTAGGDRSSRRGRRCDGASCHGQTRSSCPPATSRLITAERRVDTVELTRLSLASALPALAGGMRAIDDEVEVRSAGEAKT